jgi:anti-sigma28 factor (negative regulator of flagellin synthesis)
MRDTHLNGVRTRTRKLETTHKGIGSSTIRIELLRARIRTGCYQVNGQSLAACILVKEAQFFRL